MTTTPSALSRWRIRVSAVGRTTTLSWPALSRPWASVGAIGLGAGVTATLSRPTASRQRASVGAIGLVLA